jgi:hypothetical protein
MKHSHDGNIELRKAVRAFAKREQLTDTEAIHVIAKRAGYAGSVKIYEFLNDTRRPNADNRTIIAQILKRRAEKLWPPKVKER